MARKTDRFAASVAICTHDRYDLLSTAVASVQAQTLGRKHFEILVIDNTPNASRSRRESRRYNRAPGLSWHHEPSPGLSAARNRGLREARGEVIAFLDDDARAHEGWLEAALGALESRAKHSALVGGKVLPDWRTPVPRWLHADLLPYLSVCDLSRYRRPLRPGEWVMGTNMAFRVSVLRELGGFDTTLGRRGGGDLALVSNEEIELVQRIKETGAVALYEPSMVVSHLVAASRLTQTWFRRRMVWQAVSDYLMNPVEESDAAPKKWEEVVSYLASIPPAFRNPRGFYASKADPDEFKRQLRALYCYTLNSLSGFAGLNEDGNQLPPR